MTSSSLSVYRPGGVKFTSCLTAHNLVPDRYAGRIPDLPEFVSPSRAFYLGKVAVALEHQVGDAPDVDFRDHAGRLSGERLFTLNPPERWWRISSA